MLQRELLILAFCLALHGSTRQGSVLGDDESRHTTEFVTVGKIGRSLTVPVEVAGKPLLGMIDTGSTTCVFDVSLRGLLKGEAQRRTGDTPAGEIPLEYYEAPNLILAGSEIGERRLEVACTDLSRIQRATLEPVDLVLGMDVLRQFTISIYPLDGVVSCERSSPRCAKGGLEFSCDDDGVPSIVVAATHLPPSGVDKTSISFVIDTGFLSPVHVGAPP